jgi:hypothetical protein
MVGGDDYDLGVVAAQDRSFEALQRQVALLTVEFGEIFDEDC